MLMKVRASVADLRLRRELSARKEKNPPVARFVGPRPETCAGESVFVGRPDESALYKQLWGRVTLRDELSASPSGMSVYSRHHLSCGACLRIAPIPRICLRFTCHCCW